MRGGLVWLTTCGGRLDQGRGPGGPGSQVSPLPATRLLQLSVSVSLVCVSNLRTFSGLWLLYNLCSKFLKIAIFPLSSLFKSVQQIVLKAFQSPP